MERASPLVIALSAPNASVSARTGMGLPAYVNTIRLINAKAMLSSGAKVAEAAMACGFESLSNFDRVFRRETGMSPREYVNLVISNKA